MSWPMPCSIFRVYSTYTAQLSSKRKGMEAEGKTITPEILRKLVEGLR